MTAIQTSQFALDQCLKLRRKTDNKKTNSKNIYIVINERTKERANFIFSLLISECTTI